MGRKGSLFLALSVAIALLDGAFVYMNSVFTRNALEESFQSEAQRMRTSVETLLSQTYRGMLTMATFVANAPPVQQLFMEGYKAVEAEGGGAGGSKAAAARKKLYELVGPNWQDIQKKFAVRQLHFHIGEKSTSFLRVHRPNRFGDDLFEVRHTLVDASRFRTAITGFETGRVYAGLRGVVPVSAWDPGQNRRVHVGTVEVGTSFRGVLKILDERYGTGVGVLLKKSHINSAMWPDFIQRRFGSGIESCDCVVEAASREGVETVVRTAARQGNPFTGTGTQLLHVGQNHYLLGYLPLRDYLGTKNKTRADVGSIMFWRNVNAEMAAASRAQYSNMLYGLFAFLMIEILLFFTFRFAKGRLEREVEIKTDELQVAKEKAESEEKAAADKSGLLEATFQNISQGIAIYDAEDKLVANNAKYAEIFDFPTDFLKPGLWRGDIIKHLYARGYYGKEADESYIEARLQDVRQRKTEFHTQDNGITFLYERIPMPNGFFVTTATDITEQLEFEQQLRQSQKMDAIGQLTGGVAHDFNNLLMILMGNIDLARQTLKDGGDIEPFLENLMWASERGAKLTGQLLSFARKQPLFPKIVDIAGLVTGVGDLLRSTLEETIQIDIQCEDDAGTCKVDPNQLETAILNLAINARDAMPDGGTLTIRVSAENIDAARADAADNFGPGDYVLIEVADTGIGIDEAAFGKVFDPFYTTKGVGEGSGLGLSMVYGFVKQSGGHIEIDSRRDSGTAVKIFLPKSDSLAEKDPVPTQLPTSTTTTARILLVEDEEDVRTVSANLLRSHGHEVLEAADGRAALELATKEKPFDILLTDIVLPGGFSGFDLAREIAEEHPSIKIIYSSGYTQNLDQEKDLPGDAVELISKPYRPSELLEKIQRIMDS